MKQKFQNSLLLHEFILSELKKIVGVGGNVKAEGNILHYQIYPDEDEKCLWQSALRDLFKFITKYKLSYYIDFDFGYFRVYTSENTQKNIGTL